MPVEYIKQNLSFCFPFFFIISFERKRLSFRAWIMSTVEELERLEKEEKGSQVGVPVWKGHDYLFNAWGLPLPCRWFERKRHYWLHSPDAQISQRAFGLFLEKKGLAMIFDYKTLGKPWQTGSSLLKERKIVVMEDVEGGRCRASTLVGFCTGKRKIALRNGGSFVPTDNLVIVLAQKSLEETFGKGNTATVQLHFVEYQLP